jgi:hypothetical protein
MLIYIALLETGSNTIKGVRQFQVIIFNFKLLASYYRKHILNFSTIADPFTDLTTRGVKAYPNYFQPFIPTTDVSNFATGAILSQIRDKKRL